MTADEIAEALGAGRTGDGWMARCPAHDDRTPSLSINERDGMVLVHCHAGCAQTDVIGALRQMGLWGTGQADHAGALPQRRREFQDVDRTAGALSLWQKSCPAAGTFVEAYLASRKLIMPPSPSLRFHHGLKHPSGGIWPCMIALVTRGDDALPLAIHRTFLGRDGRGKAPVDPSRMMLGPCRGGAVRLGDPSNLLMVGEGVETCLAAMQATGHPAWAALSTSGLRALELPRRIRQVIVLADGDEAGEAAARNCARRWACQGRRVRIARPPHGLDFNDMLLGHAPTTEGIGI